VYAEDLRKRYGPTEALRGLSLAINQGTVLGLLGRNGAGKTTALRILTTLLRPDSGYATVAGFDVTRHPGQVRQRIGLAGQFAAVDDRLTGRENLTLVGILYHLGRRPAQARADEMLARFDLQAAADRQVRTYSGGMRRRLDLAAALIAAPQVLFLDEPTTGLDPASRLNLWQLIRDQVAGGATVLLTTQYLDEADQLANRIVVVDRGEVIAEGSPDELKRSVGQERLDVVVSANVQAAAAALGRLAPPSVDAAARRITIGIRAGVDDIAAAALALRDAGVPVVDFAVHRPSLDDVFLTLTSGQRAAPAQPELEGSLT
jgi:ABC-2 type transport system ATP-binding protein